MKKESSDHGRSQLLYEPNLSTLTLSVMVPQLSQLSATYSSLNRDLLIFRQQNCWQAELLLVPSSFPLVYTIIDWVKKKEK